MKYYEAVDDMRLRNRWLLGFLLMPDGKEAPRWVFSAGEPVEWSAPLSVEVYQAGRNLDFSFNDYHTLIVSEKARRVFEQLAPAAVQYFPLNVPGAEQPYFIANIIEQVDCLDEKLSHVERFVPNDPVRPDLAGQISLVLDLHIDADRATGHHLFRLMGHDIAVIISEKLKYALEKSGVTGIKYNHVTSPNIADFRVKFAERQRRLAAQ